MDNKELEKLATSLALNLEAFIEELGYHAPGKLLESAECALYKWKHRNDPVKGNCKGR